MSVISRPLCGRRVTTSNQKVKTEKTRKRSKFHFLYAFLFKILIVALIVWITLTYLLAIQRVEGNSMFPAVRDGDLCIFYRLDDVHLDDVVLYESAEGMKIGRVLAVAGQKVDFSEDGGIFVNGSEPEETITYQTFPAEHSDVSFPYKVPENSVFIMNDFRSDTNDGRIYGAVSKDQVAGKLVFVLRRRGF